MDGCPVFKQRRVRKPKRFYDDTSSSEPEENFRCMVFNVVVDTLIQELSDRFENLFLVSKRFQFMAQMDQMTQAELEESVTTYCMPAEWTFSY